MRILIVEDDPALSRQLAETLSRAGDAVDCARDGEEGHFLGDTEPYDAVVLDLGLPGLDGITVRRRWRAEGRSMPVLILTARGSWPEKVQGIDAGADDYLAKPFQMEERLGEIVVGTGIDPLHLLGPTATRRQDQDRHGAPFGPPPPAYRDPIEPWQAEIEDDGVVGLGVSEEVPLLAVAGAIDRVPGA